MTVDLDKLLALAVRVREKQPPTAPPQRIDTPWRINNLSADSTEVYIYGDIGDWGVSALDFVNELNAVRTPNLDVRINSDGGKVFDGVAIYEAIKRHPAASTAHVDGVAASAASFIAMGCDTVAMPKTARMMIHDAGIGGVYIMGNAADIRASVTEVLAYADLLDSLSDMIAGIYADKAGGEVAAWRATMATDRWYTAEEAKAAGLADVISGEPPAEPAARQATPLLNSWDPSEFLKITKGVFL